MPTSLAEREVGRGVEVAIGVVGAIFATAPVAPDIVGICVEAADTAIGEICVCTGILDHATTLARTTELAGGTGFGIRGSDQVGAYTKIVGTEP